MEDDGTKRRSHEVVMQGRRFVLTGMDGEELGSFATLGAATKAGFAASAEALEHGQGKGRHNVHVGSPEKILCIPNADWAPTSVR